MKSQAEPSVQGPTLDFIVIGAQKGGTTSIWQYLRSHPGITLPAYKEMPFFCVAGDHTKMVARIMEDLRRDSPPESIFGKVCPNYMMGMAEANVECIAERIAETLPEVRLIALLRDPIDRAISHYRMSLRREWEGRTLDAAVEELLQPQNLTLGRTIPSEVNSYVVQGEYGRILEIYLTHFPQEQIHVETTSDLDRDPGMVVDRILGFLGLEPGHRPDDLGVHHFRGGTRPRLDDAGEKQLFEFLEKNIWPKLVQSDAERLQFAFNFFFQTWNVVPDDARPELSNTNRKRLEEHYEEDGKILSSLGISAPWLAKWHHGQ